MYKKTVDKRAKRCYSRIYRTKYIKMLIRKALYAKGFQRVPQPHWAAAAASGVFPSLAHTAFESVQSTAGRSRYRASTRYTLRNFYMIITAGIWIWVETRYYYRPL